MIQARFSRSSDGSLQEVQISGHAGSGPYGYDIVCAAVSSLAINFVNALIAIAGVQADVDINEREGGFISVILPSSLEASTSRDAQLFFEAFLLGMTNLSNNASDFVATQVIKQN